MSSIANVQVPAPVLFPRGASIAAAVAVAVARGFTRMLRVLRPRPLTRFEEAQRVLDLAERLRESDPGLSSDLLAAAARHLSAQD